MKSTTEKSDMRVNVMPSNAQQKTIDENRHILRQIVRAVVYLGKQGIAFRGKIENITSTKKPRNTVDLFGLLCFAYTCSSLSVFCVIIKICVLT